ncbi:tetratricopeptide repeat protein [Roseococcus sp. SDR]|uniref:cytochrome c3 family protein n=1 Tax=Roseococcus sp. SDR TaxID=2835532 RepID=UPI001BCF777A|nr:cytochrome c3 family protein [Roseococcus sp. SDR]MBS7789720.1 tetratricopeptide repeat protein [Roseococcus sp. SDR]MBV1845034.1 tetratricopeptide repeat protein [Roseococcus sp. SDR]
MAPRLPDASPPPTMARRLAGSLALLAMILLPFLIAALVTAPAEPRAREAARAGFVGSATCGACHAREYADWQASDHARAMAAAAPETVLGDFSGLSVTDGRHNATFLRDGDRRLVRTDGPGGAVADFAVTETFGADPLQQYLVLMPDGRRQVLPWAWDSRPREEGGQRWYHLLPDEPLRAGDPLHWTGRDQNWNFMCASCHSTGLVRGYDAARDRYDTRWTEISVGCESCHGRGAAHVAWARDGARPGVAHHGLEVMLRDRSGGGWRFAEGDARGIARWEGPPRQATQAGTETCAPCHARARPLVPDPPPGQRFLDTHAPLLLARGEYHADGQIQGEVFEWGSFAQSRMQRAGVVCADCHQPHTGRLRAEGNAVCTQCHLPSRFEATEHHRHASGGAGAQCVACHMPAVTYMGVDRRRDHAFSIPRPDVSAAIGAPDVCTTCHAGQTQAWAAAQLAAWHGPPRGPAHPALAIHAGREAAPGADQALARLALDRAHPAILRATALSLLPARPSRAVGEAVGGTLLDPEPLVRAAALRALEGLPPQNRLHAVRLLSDDVRLVRIEAARALAPVPPDALPEAARPAFARAWAELLASEAVSAERPEAHVNIAALLAQRGDRAGAEAAYRAALARDPAFLPALVNQAAFEEARGQPDAAEALLRRAVAAHPADAEPIYALALLQVRRGRLGEATEALAAAARLAPERPHYAYAHALALHRQGRTEEAIGVLARNPRHRESLIAAAALERDRGRLVQAEAHARAALALDPRDREAAALLAEITSRATSPRSNSP